MPEPVTFTGATMPLSLGTGRDHDLAKIANRHGAHFSLRIVLEARAKEIPISLGFALVQQETGFRNVFGHDQTVFAGAGAVTEAKYRAYKRARGHTRMQGVGPAQLTWWEYQDEADRRGGCWSVAHNISVGFEVLAGLIHAHGYVDGVGLFNGTGPAAVRYSAEVRALAALWHARLA